MIDAGLEKFFAGRPASRKLFDLLLKSIEKYGAPHMQVKKTQISFGKQYKYIWVWLPQTWIKKRPVDSITLTIMTGSKLKSARIEESVSSARGYWTHHIIIKSSEEIDNELEALMRESYEFYQLRLARKQNAALKKSRTTSPKKQKTA